MDISLLREYIKEYPHHVVVFKGRREYGAIDDNAVVLSRALRCNKHEEDGLFSASNKDLKTIEKALNQKCISYILLSDDEMIDKKISFRHNQYKRMCGYYRRKNNSQARSQNEIGLDIRDYPMHLPLTLEGNNYQTNAEHVVVLLNIVENFSSKHSLDGLDTNGNSIIVENALLSAHVSYVVLEGQQIQKVVSFNDNHYSEYTTVASGNIRSEKKCDNCKYYINGSCGGASLCDNFIPVPRISDEEKSHWPKMGYASWLRTHRRRK